MTDKIIRIAGASGFWGDAAMATPQLLKAGGVDYIVYDYLAEITMSIMARARAKDPNAGFATDFVSAAMAPNLKEIARQGVKIVSNAGGVNPKSCADAVRKLIADQGLDLKVGVVTGDDILDRKEELAGAGFSEMFSGADFPPLEAVQSMNAYLGAFPVARALDMGADIVITGRVVDSAVTLGACIHEFGWTADQLDLMAAGSLAGHILECGPQATGGNFTDWHEVIDDLDQIGYPIGEMAADGGFVLTKPADTGGKVNVGTVAEQMLYEIGDPQAYMLPDVLCDFSQVTIEDLGNDRVKVDGAIGHPAPATYKVCTTFADGFRGGLTNTFYGLDADVKARRFSEAVLKRARNVLRSRNMADYTEESLEIIGAESQFGDHRKIDGSREVVMKLAVKHPDPAGVAILLKEMTGLALATPPGLSGFAGGRPKPSPVVRLFSFALPKGDLPITVEMNGQSESFADAPGQESDPATFPRPEDPAAPSDAVVEVPLVKLAWGRSGDKGNKANVGIIARKADYLPYIWSVLTEDVVRSRYGHFLEGGAESGKVTRYYLPGSHSINFLMDEALGGGGIASLRNDPQAKGFAQIILDHPIPVPQSIADEVA